ncbi:hypothetical protein IFM89_029304 [Coptis chinensis]|uniref:Uncharacterized protein n=1 Tax=Coptis chinensis TaxID=261450 RepID=A0A835LVS9_9MAGN|nr:hypothetical protein IFM89_029304 [Coptis chinensis]
MVKGERDRIDVLRPANLYQVRSKYEYPTADPGAVATNLMRELSSHLSVLAFTVLKVLGLLQSPEDKVNSIIDADLAPPSRHLRCPQPSDDTV